MKQLRDYPIDDAKYYERIWNAELAAGHWHFDAVRHRALAKHVRPGHKIIDIGAGVWGTAQYIGTELKTPNVTLVDLDDFCEDNNALDRLFQMRAKVPEFKVNLFTIPGLCSSFFLNEVRKLDWIDMIPHGYKHPHSRECEHWTYSESREYLEYVSYMGFTKGFRAPGWQISDGMYEALVEFNFWVADQAYNNHRRPPELRAYILDQPGRIHGHIGHLGGHNANALELIYDDLLKLRGEFMFIKDLWSK